MTLALFARFRPHPWHYLAGALAAVLLVLAASQALAGQKMPYSQGRFWRIEVPGAAPNHLLGTMHSADRQIVTLPGPAAKAFARADSLAIEMLLDEETMLQFAQEMIIDDGRTLEDIVGPRLIRQIYTIGDRYGRLPDQLEYMAPWAVILAFSLPPSEVKRSAQGKLPLDLALQSNALARGVPVYGLETLPEHIGYFIGLSEEDQVALLRETLRQNREVERLFARMKKYYLAGDLEALYGLLRENTAGTNEELLREFEEALIFNRNELMVRRMDELLGEGNAFIAVGALHLPGERGILSLLERRGYKLSRVH